MCVYSVHTVVSTGELQRSQDEIWWEWFDRDRHPFFVSMQQILHIRFSADTHKDAPTFSFFWPILLKKNIMTGGFQLPHRYPRAEKNVCHGIGEREGQTARSCARSMGRCIPSIAFHCVHEIRSRWKGWWHWLRKSGSYKVMLGSARGIGGGKVVVRIVSFAIIDVSIGIATFTWLSDLRRSFG